jgi:ATP phosphoribosyltransferase
LLTPLGFGHADVVVAVPKGWIDASSMEDLEEIAADFHSRHGRRMRVATKYVNLTRRFFAMHGVADYRIVESLGATEGAPASGTAELIVDITTTGSTLEANALKVLDDGVMLRSQANLVAALSADWSENARALARQFLARISAEQAARTTRSIHVTFTKGNGAALVALGEKAGATLRSGADASPLVFETARVQAASIASALVAAGAVHVSVAENDYIFNACSPLADLLEERLAILR